MPLHTSISRNGDTLKLRWSDFHVAAMAIAAACDDPTNPEAKLFKDGPRDRPEFFYQHEDVVPEWFDREWEGKDQTSYPDVPCPISRNDAWTLASYGYLAMTPLNSGGVTLKRRHSFLDCTDGEILTLEPGDVLRAFRD
jgi:hypothetical protein